MNRCASGLRGQPVPRGRDPLQVDEIAARILEQRPFVDHRQLEVGVRVVHRLPPGLGDRYEREGQRAESERRGRPGLRACRRVDDPAQVGRARDERRDRERQHEGGFDKHREGEIATRAHESEAVRDIPGRGRDGEAREREEAQQHERVVTEAPVRRSLGRRYDRDGRDERGGSERGRDAVHGGRVLGRHRALAPEPAQLAIRLERRRALAPLQARLPVLHQSGQERR